MVLYFPLRGFLRRLSLCLPGRVLVVFGDYLRCMAWISMRCGFHRSALEYALLALWLATIRIFATSLSYLVTTAEFIKQVTSIFQRLRTQWERRQWERRTCESIIRKQLSKPVVHKRPSPQHSTTPLFQRGVNHDIYALFLPEELPTEEVTKTISPIPFRHMYDPRMFNHVRKIGSGTFGSVTRLSTELRAR